MRWQGREKPYGLPKCHVHMVKSLLPELGRAGRVKFWLSAMILSQYPVASEYLRAKYLTVQPSHLVRFNKYVLNKMSNIEAGELHSKLSRPNYNLLLDSLNLLFKTTLKHSRLQTSVTSLVNCNKLMKLGFDQSVAFLQNKFRSF